MLGAPYGFWAIFRGDSWFCMMSGVDLRQKRGVYQQAGRRDGYINTSCFTGTGVYEAKYWSQLFAGGRVYLHV